MPRTTREEVAAFKRLSILKEAARQFYKKGYDGTRIDEIAAALGVTKPFIYYHFKNKTEILDEICVQSTAMSVARLEAAIASDGAAIDRIRDAVRGLVLQAIEHQEGIAICFREEKYVSLPARRRLEDHRRRYDELLGDLLARANEDGTITVPDTEIATQALTGAITWSFVWYPVGGRLKPEAFAESIIHLAMSMLEAREPDGGA